MDKNTLNSIYKKYGLEKSDTYAHNHYTIITRSGIEKIERKNNIKIKYEVIEAERDFAVIKAYGTMGDVSIETFGSALHGPFGKGNTQQLYIIEIAEKRAMSRIVLKLTGLYAEGFFGEDESESFKKEPSSVEFTNEVFEKFKKVAGKYKTSNEAIRDIEKKYKLTNKKKLEIIAHFTNNDT